MSYATLILGESGTGKTCSLRNFNPNDVLLIQPIKKPLPFKAKDWKHIELKVEDVRTESGIQRKTSIVKGGNIVYSDDIDYLIQMMHKTKKKIIVIDDWQYILSFKMMEMRNVGGYDKWNQIGGRGFDIARAASQLEDDKRVYILAHTETEDGITRIKTVGKMLSEKICIEGMFTTVLRTYVDNGSYKFQTQNSGYDTVKSPMGMFEESKIDNDLSFVDKAICEYYGIGQDQTDQQEVPVDPVEPEPVNKPSKVDFETGVRVDELLQAINDVQSIDQLNALVEQLKSLNLPKDSDEYSSLGSAFKKKRHELTIDEELNYI